MTGINATKTIRNLEIVNKEKCKNPLARSRACPWASRQWRAMQRKFDFYREIFSFFQIGSGANRWGPAGKGGGRRRSRFAFLQLGPRIQNWDPILSGSIR